MSKPKAFSRKDRDLLLRGAHYYIDQRRVMGEHWEEWQAVRRLLAATDPAKEAVYRAAKRFVRARFTPAEYQRLARAVERSLKKGGK